MYLLLQIPIAVLSILVCIRGENVNKPLENPNLDEGDIVTGEQMEKDGDLGEDPIENPNLFEGDIVTDEQMEKWINGDSSPVSRNAVPKDIRLWPNGRVPYEITPDYNQLEESKIKKGMEEYERKTCIRFVPKESSDQNYVRIFRGKGCYSLIGKFHRPNYQPLSLGYGCVYHGTIVHELGHTIGFEHEHTRPDRDDYVNIYWDAIKDEHKYNFNKKSSEQVRLHGPYDYYSIMHYGETNFSKDKKSKTMKAKQEGIRLKKSRDKPGLAPEDIKKIKKLYKC